eukprot:scaffold1550_cov27-Tisochrysis_lutea.AAC.2
MHSYENLAHMGLQHGTCIGVSLVLGSIPTSTTQPCFCSLPPPPVSNVLLELRLYTTVHSESATVCTGASPSGGGPAWAPGPGDACCFLVLFARFRAIPALHPLDGPETEPTG